MSEQWLIIGISGTTCGGKTTLANNLHEKFPIYSKIISQDDYYFEVDDPRIEDIPELKHKNFDSLTSLDMEKMLEDINAIVQNGKGNFILNKFNGDVKNDLMILLTYQVILRNTFGLSIFSKRKMSKRMFQTLPGLMSTLKINWTKLCVIF